MNGLTTEKDSNELSQSSIKRMLLFMPLFPVNAGRIHSATVKTVNVTKSTVNVEWAEKGITKGKEVGT